MDYPKKVIDNVKTITIEDGKLKVVYGYRGKDRKELVYNLKDYEDWMIGFSGPKQDWPTYIFYDEADNLDTLLEGFNAILKSNGKTPISLEDTLLTYKYLEEAFELATDEWSNNTYGLFSLDIYKEVYNFRGSSKKYEAEAKKAFVSWLLAMCISELVPTSGTMTNIQTELFHFAYDYAGGRSIPLYGDFDIHADPMVARLASGAVYAILRADYSFEEIKEFRKELGGSVINASEWNDLGYFSKDSRSITNLGYLVNSEVIIPSAPGPYSNDTDPSRSKPFDEGQDKGLFYTKLDNCNWHLYNYKKDAEIDDYIVANYNLGSATYNTAEAWESIPEKEKRLQILHAAVMPIATDHYFFGSRRIIFNGVIDSIDDYNNHFNKYIFSETTESANNEHVYDICGPFSQFEGKMFTSGYGVTSTMRFFQNVMNIADNSRFPSFHTEYGRRRPLGGETPGSARNELNGHPLNGILNGSIGCLFADDEAGYQKIKNCDDFPHDNPKSYPSGHATMMWTVAMILGQMNPEEIIDYMKAAYSIGVGRTIGRFHWTSDVIYGRLFGTMILPILNAMSGLQASYESAKRVINDEPTGDWSVKLIIKNLTGNPIQSTGEIRLYVDNHIGVNTYLPDAWEGAGALYTFGVGETDFSSLDVHCKMNGEEYMDDSYDGKLITEVRFYDYRHWNNSDAGFSAALDTSDSRCDRVLKKSGGTYVIKITKL